MRRFAAVIFGLLALAGCQQPTVPATRPGMGTGGGTGTSQGEQRVLLDFERPEVPVTWVEAGAATTSADVTPGSAPASQPEGEKLQRSSLKPQAGLWSLAVPVSAAGAVRYTPPKPLDLGAYDVLTVQVAHEEAPGRNGACTALVRITDADGNSFASDAYPVLSTWQAATCDLRQALHTDIDLSRIASIALELRPGEGAAPLHVKTDTWAVNKQVRNYVGSSVGAARTFFVQSRGGSIHVGSVDQYEMIISDQGLAPSAQPWLQVFSAPPPVAGTSNPPREVLGQPFTGLYLLDQDGLSAVRSRQNAADDAAPAAPDVPAAAATPTWGPQDRWAWPASIAHAGSTIQWQVVWATPVGAIIEGHQEAGGFDSLGEPMLSATWRLMVYQWGQVFMHVQWTQSGQSDSPVAIPRPVSWALLSMPRMGREGQETPESTEATQRLLTEVYPATFRQGLTTALPHRMQSNASVAMIAPANPQKDNFWWSHEAVGHPTRWIFGAGIPSPATATGPVNGESNCMLLVNSPNGLAMAGAFGQYLVPPKIIAKQGELDRNFPGDLDNDGFVESYGFQVVRLAGGRAMFTIYPQERPIFYPPILFTVPATERDALDLKHSKLLINIDGKQFANPPQFPDGSFLLQVPYVLDRPVNVEAILVK